MTRPKRILITAGSTATHIDRVRIISNVFRGRTGELIAQAAAAEGWQVTLLTSRPDENALTLPLHGPLVGAHRISRIRYRTYDDLAKLMEMEVRGGGYDAIVHSAAVSDFRPVRITAVDENGRPVSLKAGAESVAKLPSIYRQVKIELEPTLKLVDLVRDLWGFRKTLVKFKLQVGLTDDELIAIASRSRAVSQADMIVANCLEWSDRYAYIIDAQGTVEKIPRLQLGGRLMRRLTEMSSATPTGKAER